MHHHHAPLVMMRRPETKNLFQKALAPRLDLPLEDATALELIVALETQTFEWRPWIPKSKRKKTQVLPIGYTPGDERLFFTNPCITSVVNTAYLLALLRAEDQQPANQLSGVQWLRPSCPGRNPGWNWNLMESKLDGTGTGWKANWMELEAVGNETGWNWKWITGLS